jgi:hypothetical protein
MTNIRAVDMLFLDDLFESLTHEGFNLDSPLGRKALEGMKPGWPKILARLEDALQG